MSFFQLLCHLPVHKAFVSDASRKQFSSIAIVDTEKFFPDRKEFLFVASERIFKPSPKVFKIFLLLLREEIKTFVQFFYMAQVAKQKFRRYQIFVKLVKIFE